MRFKLRVPGQLAGTAVLIICTGAGAQPIREVEGGVMVEVPVRVDYFVGQQTATVVTEEIGPFPINDYTTSLPTIVSIQTVFPDSTTANGFCIYNHTGAEVESFAYKRPNAVGYSDLEGYTVYFNDEYAQRRQVWVVGVIPSQSRWEYPDPPALYPVGFSQLSPGNASVRVAYNTGQAAAGPRPRGPGFEISYAAPAQPLRGVAPQQLESVASGVTSQLGDDFNNNGSASVHDVFDFLAAYFMNDPSADINGSGSVTVQDVFDFLGHWFAGC